MVRLESYLCHTRQSRLHLTSPVTVLHNTWHTLRIGGSALCTRLLRYYTYLPPASSAQLDQARYRGTAGWTDWIVPPTGAGYGLWLGAGEHGPGPVINSTMGYPAAALCQNCDNGIIYWLRRIWRNFWPRYGHWRHAWSYGMAAVLSCAAWHPSYSRAFCHRRYDGALWRNCPRSSGSDANGRRDDRKPVFACSRHDRGRCFLDNRR